MASAEDLDYVSNDPIQSIEIDEIQRVIQFYGNVGTILMPNPEDGTTDLYDLNFKADDSLPTRNVIIDESLTISVPVFSQDNETEFMIDNEVHRIKIGAPTRELWIDGQWYSCYFDNRITVPIGGRVRSVFLEGPAPRVDIGQVARKDFCAGKVIDSVLK